MTCHLTHLKVPIPPISDFPLWNFNELESPLKHLTLHDPETQQKPIGIQTPVCIVGGPGTHFNQHVEENLLHAINYLFDIDNTYPKHWYSLRPQDQTLFEEYMKKRFPQLFRDCANYLGHRTIMVNPEVILKKLKLKVHYGIQEPGMFAITFSGSYHFGYNEGFNLVEVFWTLICSY